MTCYYQRPAWIERDHQGNPVRNENGKLELRFSNKGSHIDPDYELPCGKCVGCRASQARDWGVRMYHESLCHEQNCMVTLTYDDDHLPPDHKINKEDPQKFIKRLRYHGYKVRYVLTGEYGDNTWRPHYHAAIFGADFLGGATKLGSMYTNSLLDDIWGKGFCSIIPLQIASCMYVAGYVNKKVGDPDTFALQSTNPPIGKAWLLNNMHRLGNRSHFAIGGQQYPIPRKYFEWSGEFDYIAGKRKLNNTLGIEAARNREINFNARQKLREHKI